jgi:hypothetical protein
VVAQNGAGSVLVARNGILHLKKEEGAGMEIAFAGRTHFFQENMVLHRVDFENQLRPTFKENTYSLQS